MKIVSYCASSGMARFACAQQGCRDCLEVLMAEHENLAWFMVSKQLTGSAEYADLQQEGRIGLWRAIVTFDPTRGVCFSTYACTIILRHVWQAVRVSRKATGWLEAKRAGDSLVYLLQTWQAEQIHQALAEALETLPEQQRTVLVWHYGLSGAPRQTLTQIGRTWHLTRERIRQIKEEALAQLRLPAYSIRLRTLCERRESEHYRQALRQNRKISRRR